MRALSVIISLLGFLGAEAGKVIELTSSNFDHDTQVGAGMTTGAWFVKFYAPWCGHCKRLAPVWEELVDELEDDAINVAEVDATVSRDLGERFGVKGYPTLLLFKDDMMYKHSGSRDLKNLAEFARSTYATVEGKAVPKALGTVDKVKRALNKLVSDVAHIWEYRRLAGASLLLSGAMSGLALGTAIGAVLTHRNYRKYLDNKKQGTKKSD